MPYLNTGTVGQGGRVARSLPRLLFANAVESRKTKGIVTRATTPPTRHMWQRSALTAREQLPDNIISIYTDGSGDPREIGKPLSDLIPG